MPITIATAITMSKPDYPHFNTQTLELRHCIDTAITAISPDHWVPPTRELFADPPIIQVSENETKSDDEEVIPSSYPLEVSTFI